MLSTLRGLLNLIEYRNDAPSVFYLAHLHILTLIMVQTFAIDKSFISLRHQITKTEKYD